MQSKPFRRRNLRWPLALVALSSFSVPAQAQSFVPVQAVPCAAHGSPFNLRGPRPATNWGTAPASVRALPKAEIDQLLFDEPGDGALWARGASYKARFGREGATIVPFFGSDAPHDYPLELRVDAATLGGVPLDTAPRDRATRAGKTVRIERGSFVEEYALTTGSLEQRFVFDELPGRGELVLRLQVATELAGSDLGATLRFENDLGHVDYGEAFAIDAAGRRIALDSRLIDGAIQLVVPAAFVESATLPLTIDPLVTTFTVGAFSIDDVVPDVAYDVTTDMWCVVWTTVFSASDLDCYAKFATGAGVLQPALVIVDVTTQTWATPKIANNNDANVFLVVAAVVPPSGIADIRGRIVNPGTQTAGTQIPISPPDGAYRNWPDVGGDPFPSSPSYFCVVWQRYVSSTNLDIEMRMVAPSGALVSGLVPLENGPEWHELPSISSSLGVDPGGVVSAWTVVWQHPTTPTNHDCFGAQIGWSGTITHAMYPFANFIFDEIYPQVSMLRDPQPGELERPYMLVVENASPGDSDVVAYVYRGTQFLGGTPVSDDSLGEYEYSGRVECDGKQFLVGYVSRATPTSTDDNVWLSNYYWFDSYNAVLPCTLSQPLAVSSVPERDVALYSMAGSGGPSGRYFATYDSFGSFTGSYDVQGAVWDGCTGGLVTSFCGGAIVCPCNNSGAAGHGCANSANPAGALLEGIGDARISADTFVLRASGMPPTATCLFFQGASAGIPGAYLGDGQRCVFGPVIRFSAKSSSGGVASYPEAGDLSISLRGLLPAAGSQVYYQAWYRDPAALCSNGPYNVTNALRVDWVP